MNAKEHNLIEVTRSFEAPLELVWKAWTEPDMFMQWYGPKGFTVPNCQIDLKVGGHHLWSMQAPNGNRMFYTGIFKEIVPMERLVFTDGMCDEEGNPISPTVMGMPEGSPMSMEVTVSFAHSDGKTTVTVSHVGIGEGGERAGMGWTQAFDKLAQVLAE